MGLLPPFRWGHRVGCAVHTVLANKPACFAVVIPGPKVDKVRLVIPVLPAIPKGVRVGVDRLLVAKGVVVVARGRVSVFPYPLDNIAMRVKGVVEPVAVNLLRRQAGDHREKITTQIHQAKPGCCV